MHSDTRYDKLTTTQNHKFHFSRFSSETSVTKDASFETSGPTKSVRNRYVVENCDWFFIQFRHRSLSFQTAKFSSNKVERSKTGLTTPVEWLLLLQLTALIRSAIVV